MEVNMNKEYKEVPAILTGKDLEYLKDIFGWNYTIYKEEENAYSFIKDNKIKKMVKQCADFCYENMNTVLNILEDGDYNEQ